MNKASAEKCRPIRIAHVIYRLDIGGMENGLVNLINGLSTRRFCHTVVCLTHATNFRRRINRGEVEIIELHKPAGKQPIVYRQFYSLLKRVRPDIVHTRNLGTLDLQWAAVAARCPTRIHGEHGWSTDDLAGVSKKYKFIRRLCDPTVQCYVAVSKDIYRWLRDVIGIADIKIQQIYNGVDTDRFSRKGDDGVISARNSSRVVFGAVGRHDAIKGLDVFLAAVNQLLTKRPDLRESIYFVLAGDGPEHQRCVDTIQNFQLMNVTYLPGKVDDVPMLLRSFDVFVQPSLNEGISNTVLEAMSARLPIIATGVGGNPELIRDDLEGYLIAPGDVNALAICLERYVDYPALRIKHGDAARERVEAQFSLNTMLDSYAALYARLARHQLTNEIT